MTLWVDAQLSPLIAGWIATHFPVAAYALRDIGLRDSADEEIFAAARQAGIVVLTKDIDFVMILERLGSPPKVIWLTCGNTSNATLQQILSKHLTTAIRLLESGENLVEIGSL